MWASKDQGDNRPGVNVGGVSDDVRRQETCYRSWVGRSGPVAIRSPRSVRTSIVVTPMSRAGPRTPVFGALAVGWQQF